MNGVLKILLRRGQYQILSNKTGLVSFFLGCGTKSYFFLIFLDIHIVTVYVYAV